MAEKRDSISKTYKSSVFSGIVDFVQGVRNEYSKIIFPSGETLKKETIATLVVSVIIGVLIFLLDTGFKELLGLVL